MLHNFLQRRPYNAAIDLVDANVARGLGNKTAFVDSERSITFGSLQSRTFQFAVLHTTVFPMSVGATTVLLPHRATPDAVFLLS